jgi:hypothetical protein
LQRVGACLRPCDRLVDRRDFDNDLLFRRAAPHLRNHRRGGLPAEKGAVLGEDEYCFGQAEAVRRRAPG